MVLPDHRAVHTPPDGDGYKLLCSGGKPLPCELAGPPMAGNREALILVVEDNPTNLLALKALLTYIGVQADYVQNGLEAVAAVANGAYRLVLMDLMMPGLDGFAATKLIRRHEYGTGRHTPVVAVTALDPEFSK